MKRIILGLLLLLAMAFILKNSILNKMITRNVQHYNSTNIFKKNTLYANKRTGMSNIAWHFIENKGQWDPQIRFFSQKGEISTFFSNNSIKVQLAHNPQEGVVLDFNFLNSSPNVEVSGMNLKTGRYNYFQGNDPQKWVREVPTFSSVLYQSLYEGIDLRVYEKRGSLEYDLTLEPGVDLSQVRIAVNGIQELGIDETGRLIMQTELGEVYQSPPTTWYVLPSGEKEIVTANFSILDQTSYGFEVPNRRKELAMVIDPGLEYSTFFGGTGLTIIHDVAVDQDETIVYVGYSYSTNFPLTPGAYNTTQQASNNQSAFISRIQPQGNGNADLIFSTFIGSNTMSYGNEDVARAVVIDSAGDIVVGGSTIRLWGDPFPTTTGAFMETRTPPSNLADGFIVKLNGQGDQLLYSTFIGGDGEEAVSALVVDDLGVVTATGGTTSCTDPQLVPGKIPFPTTLGAFDTIGDCPVYPGYYVSASDVFVFRLALNGNGSADLLYSTFLGGTGADGAIDIAMDNSGVVTIIGTTQLAHPNAINASVFPTTTGAFKTNNISGNWDVFISRFSLDGQGTSDLIYSSFFGGDLQSEFGNGIALDPKNDQIVNITGKVLISSQGYDFPITPGAFDSTFGGNQDAFVSRLSLDSQGANDLLYSTFLGGDFVLSSSGNDESFDIEVDRSGGVYIAGQTDSFDFPTTSGAAQSLLGTTGVALYDGFVSYLRLDGQGQQDLIYSTYLGGVGFDRFLRLDLDEETGSIAVVGDTNSQDYPITPGAFHTMHNIPSYSRIGVVSQLSMLPTGVEKFGQWSTGGQGNCEGPITLSVQGMPQEGNQTFAIIVNGAPPSTYGALVFGQPDLIGSQVAGFTAHIDINQPVTVWNTSSDQNGFLKYIIPIPSGTASFNIAVQSVWYNTATCGGSGTYSASNALDITIQP